MAKRIVVDRSLCDTQAVCVGLAPANFGIADDDTMEVLNEHPSAGEMERVVAAVRSCPKQAISLVDDEDAPG
jgi:ferredoxin